MAFLLRNFIALYPLQTTQLPTYILDEMLAEGRGSEAYIICTQPRRIAAITVAERVSFERCESSSAGNTIGYQVRLQSVCSENTKILHCTTGVLLRKMQDPAFLSKVSHVVMDEVHERQVETDFLMALLKSECARRPHMKLVRYLDCVITVYLYFFVVDLLDLLYSHAFSA